MREQRQRLMILHYEHEHPTNTSKTFSTGKKMPSIVNIKSSMAHQLQQMAPVYDSLSKNCKLSLTHNRAFFTKLLSQFKFQRSAVCSTGGPLGGMLLPSKPEPY